MAPEVLTEETYSEKADVYSFGLIMWELVSKKMPFENVPPYGIPVQVTKGTVMTVMTGLIEQEFALPFLQSAMQNIQS